MSDKSVADRPTVTDHVFRTGGGFTQWGRPDFTPFCGQCVQNGQKARTRAEHVSEADLVESFAHLAMSLPEPHGILCPCLVCADKRVEENLKPGLIDPWDLIGARWLP